MPADFAVAVLFFERPDQTVACVRSFALAGRPVYVFDNGSSPTSRARFDAGIAGLPGVRLISSPVNLGVAAGRNRLLEISGEDLLLFADSDITVATDRWDELLLERAARAPEVEAFLPRIHNHHEGRDMPSLEVVIEGRDVHLRRLPAGRDTNLIRGGACLVRRSLFERLGPYDEALFVGSEDTELAIRAVRMGNPVRARHVPDVLLEHRHERAVTSVDRHAARVRYDHGTMRRSLGVIEQKHDVVMPGYLSRWTRAQRRIAGVGRGPRETAVAALGESAWYRSRRVLRGLTGRRGR